MRKAVLTLVLALCAAVFATAAAAATSAPAAKRVLDWPQGSAVVHYRSQADLDQALRAHPARVVRRIAQLHVAEVKPRGSLADFVFALSRRPGLSVERLQLRRPLAEPALAGNPQIFGGAYEWQWAAAHVDAVEPAVVQAAGAITIAIVDSGADLAAPDLASKISATHSVVVGTSDVTDIVGHGTFVASLAAGSSSNNEGVAGFGGDAKLMIVQISRVDDSVTDVNLASGVVYAVDHGAKIVNLSVGGTGTTTTEQNAISYAVSHGVLVIAAAGNSGAGAPVEYPAALLQPEGSNGIGGVGLAVGASNVLGQRAGFSNTGSYVSLAAPGENVFGALSSASNWTATALPGSSSGLYGYSDGTSFAAPEVAGAAALVWAANPALSAQQVASVLKASASGHGAWTPELGFGVLDVGAAVVLAKSIGTPHVDLTPALAGRTLSLRWSSPGARAYRVSVRTDEGGEQIILAATPETSASYVLRAGHTYEFTVTAIDATGAILAASQPYRVALTRAASTLALTASRTTGRRPLRVLLAAELSASAAPLDKRAVALQAFNGRAWVTVSRAETNAAGRIGWRLTLRAGSYRLRVRFAGAGDLAPAVSRIVAVRVS